MTFNPKIMEHVKLIAKDVVPVGRARIAAAVVHKKEIIGLGVCRYKTHPLQARFSSNSERIYLHAEIDAIANTLRRESVDLLSSCSLYVARMKCVSSDDRTLITGLAKPCDGCERCISAFNINSVFWTENQDV